ncbi:MAG: glycoside hydrolase family 127 protein [Lachnospiraceae bacterium]|nr:glycoside hydrolase family 127 protein [Lachnospiraceae bacterium]
MNKWNAFDISAVSLADPFLVNALDKETAYLTAFDTDKLLAGFRETAGLSLRGKTRYEGWENMLIGGHTLGHFLTAAAQAYASVDVLPAHREKLFEMLKDLATGLLECQEHSRGKRGFLFGATLPDPSNVEKQFDNVEEGKTNIITEAWVPWYTMHKILAGLVSAYELTGIEELLIVAKGVGDWTYERASSWDEALNRKVLETEFGGMNDALYELYRVTGVDRYAAAAHYFDQESLYEKIFTGSADVLNNLHANTTIPKFIGCLNRYRVLQGKQLSCGETAETVDASHYLEIAKVFWDMVVQRHTYVTGANSEWEHFGKDYVLDKERTNCNNESCNVYNMLKLTRMLYEITGEKKYGEYYERAYINHILASQDPKTGMTMYFHPMANGYFKVYGEPFNKFWCCTGSGMENFTKLGDSIYYHNEDTVLVNLYLASVLTWKEQDLVLTQTGDLTGKPQMTFRIDSLTGGDLQAKVCLRRPDWVQGEMTVTVSGSGSNARKITASKEGFVLVEDLQKGDEILVELPMEVSCCATPDDPSSLAFTYGPYVLSADLGEENEEITTTGVMVSIPARAVTPGDVIPLPEEITLEQFQQDVSRYMVPVESQASGDGPFFTLLDTGLVFAPHYQKVHQRYGIYWYLKSREEADKLKEAADHMETLDTVQPGYGQYESDELHAMEEKHTIAVTHGGTSRMAEADGYFTYRMVVEKGRENVLVVTFLKEDNGRSIHITSRHVSLYAGSLHYEGEEDRYSLTIPIPAGVVESAFPVTAGGTEKTVVPITFRGMNGTPSPRVCDFIYTRKLSE